MRNGLIDIFMAGVRRADPVVAVSNALDDVTRTPDLILGLGKAAIAMARPAIARFPNAACIIVTNLENAVDLEGAAVLVGEHPVPDGGSLIGGEALLDAAARLQEGQHCLFLISGGGSSLAVAPPGHVSLSDQAHVWEMLLASGLDIHQMNVVRQHLCRVKGGGLARAVAPATGEALILSDVVGDDIAAISSGPTVPTRASAVEAIDILTEARILDRVPESCHLALKQAQADPATPNIPSTLVGSNRLSALAMQQTAPHARLAPDPLVGDVFSAADHVAKIARMGEGMMLWGGETTVVLRGDGKGGRNQELALRVAINLRDLGRQWAFLSGGTDGRDGPTDAAGALVDQGTITRIQQAGLDPMALLAQNDSYPALKAAGDLLLTGGTGTNVADLQILRVGPPLTH